MKLHDMNVWLVSWYTPVLVEGNKFWFYAICMSIMRTVGMLLFSSETQKTIEKNHPDADQKGQESARSISPEPVTSSTSLFRRVIIDMCDLTLPASFLGWIIIGDLRVGIAMVISTVLSWEDMWRRV